MLSHKEQRIKKITSLYYSRPEIQKAIFEFSKNREICPRYFDGFGKRPDVFQYTGDMFELVKKRRNIISLFRRNLARPSKHCNRNGRTTSKRTANWLGFDNRY